MLGGDERGRHGFGDQPSAGRTGPAAQASARPAYGWGAPIAVALRWGAAGFLLGAGFWIYLGVRELAPGDQRHLFNQQGAPAAPGCTALALDRDNGHTTAAPCPGPQPTFREQLTALLGQSLRP